jgi:hypothetical protein
MPGNGTVRIERTATTKASEKNHRCNFNVSPARKLSAPTTTAALTKKKDATFITDTSTALLTATDVNNATSAKESRK